MRNATLAALFMGLTTQFAGATDHTNPQNYTWGAGDATVAVYAYGSPAEALGTSEVDLTFKNCYGCNGQPSTTTVNGFAGSKIMSVGPADSPSDTANQDSGAIAGATAFVNKHGFGIGGASFAYTNQGKVSTLTQADLTIKNDCGSCRELSASGTGATHMHVVGHNAGAMTRSSFGAFAPKR